MIKKLLDYLTTNKNKIHFAALLMMVAAPIMMYFGIPMATKALIFLGIGLMVVANILALATK